MGSRENEQHARGLRDVRPPHHSLVNRIVRQRQLGIEVASAKVQLHVRQSRLRQAVFQPGVRRCIGRRHGRSSRLAAGRRSGTRSLARRQPNDQEAQKNRR